MSNRAAWWRLAASTPLAAVKLIGLTLMAGTPATLHAQDLEPRSYSNSPIGLNFLVASYGYAEGSVLEDDQQEGMRFGVTFALPINRHQSIKLYALTGINEEAARNLDAVGLAWQYRWGGGF